MISYIRGELSAIEEDKVIVDVNGIGYGIFMPGAIYGNAPADWRGSEDSHLFECT